MSELLAKLVKSSASHVRDHHHHHQFNVHVLLRSIKGIDGCSDVFKGRAIGSWSPFG